MKINSSRIKFGVVVAAVVMALTAAVPPLSLSWVSSAQTNRQQVEDRLVLVRRVLELLIDAETGQRGFVITGKDEFLQPYHAALAMLPPELQSLEQHYADENPARRKLVHELVRLSELRLLSLAQVVRLRQAEGFAAAEVMVSSAQGKHHMDEVRGLAGQLTQLETRQLAEREHDLKTKSWMAIGFSIGCTLLTVGLLSYIGVVMAQALRRTASSEARARRTTVELESGMSEMRRRNEEMSILSEMSNVLQAEMKMDEALQVAGVFCQRLLPATSGSIYAYHASASLLELATHWGDVVAASPLLEPSACWGLRRGQLHTCGGQAELRCPHSITCDGSFEVCIPLTAYGEVLGLLNVRYHDPQVQDSVLKMGRAISEQMALTMSNAKLRQVLRDQSTRDPLTGLFNRRWMEESLKRELARSRRNGLPVSLVVVDLDHFKNINDTHGHPTGDTVLRSAAGLLSSRLRTSDVACRYGGEEFVLILPECEKSAAVRKAEQLCAELSALEISPNGRPVYVTASFGVSCSTVDGDEPETLFGAADRAVYQAKRDGRNRVVAAHPGKEVMEELA